MKEYAIYPFSVMNISQNYNQGNHVPHWQGSTNYSDKPWDEACVDSGRSYFEPQNDYIIEEVLGINSGITNTVRLKSVNKLYIPFKEEADYLYLTLTHMNEDNLKQVKVGQVLSKGSKILLEGTDGIATGNHFHITANLGKYYGLKENSNGKWCYTYDKSLLPQEAFYVDTSFTVVKNSQGSVFKEKPTDKVGTPVARNEQLDQVEVLIDNLIARNGASKNCKRLGYINKGIYNYTSKQNNDGYVWYQVENGIYIASDGKWCNELPKNTENNSLKQEITRLNEQIKSLEESIKQKDTEISTKNTEISELESQLSELSSKEKNAPKLVYAALKTAMYKIKLNENEELYIK